MSRSLSEWIGATPDTAIPPRIKVRLFEAAGKCCQSCQRPLRGGDRPEYDHRVALINGGQNRESNLQVLCSWCHGEKTGRDVGQKSASYRKRTKHYGIKRPSRMPGSRDSKWKRTLDGRTVLRSEA